MILQLGEMTSGPFEAFRVLERARYRKSRQSQSRSLVNLPSHVRVQLRSEFQRKFLQTFQDSNAPRVTTGCKNSIELRQSVFPLYSDSSVIMQIIRRGH